MKLKSDSGILEINILRRTNSETDDYWDANWLESEIKIEIPGLHTSYGTNLRIDDLQRFYDKLIFFKTGKSKNAEFTTMEEGLYLNFEIESNGALYCEGKAKIDEGNSLNFKFHTDLISLEIFLSEFTEILKSFPLIGI